MVFKGSAPLDILDVIHPIQRPLHIAVHALHEAVVRGVGCSALVEGLPAPVGVKLLRQTCNIRGDVIVHRLDVQHLLPPFLLDLGEVREVALAVGDLLHALLLQYRVHPFQQFIIGLACQLDGLVHLGLVDLILVCFVVVVHFLRRQLGVGVMAQLTQHLDVGILILGDLHVRVGLLDLRRLPIQLGLMAVIAALQRIIDGVSLLDVPVAFGIPHHIPQIPPQGIHLVGDTQLLVHPARGVSDQLLHFLGIFLLLGSALVSHSGGPALFLRRLLQLPEPAAVLVLQVIPGILVHFRQQLPGMGLCLRVDVHPVSGRVLDVHKGRADGAPFVPGVQQLRQLI